MDFKTITSEKYLRYFLSGEAHSIADPIMTEFLDDMIDVSEHMDTAVPPTEIIKEVICRCGLDGSPYDAVTQIVGGKLLDALTALEVFTLLWFVSCKNAIAYREEIYLRYADNGVIGKLLKRLA